MAAGPIADLVREPEQHDDPDREQQERGRVLRQPRPEAHRAVRGGAGAGDDREAEDEQAVREERTEDRGASDDELAGREREKDDEELGKVAERRLQRPGHRRTEALANGLGRDRDRPRKTTECGGRDGEHDHRLGVREVKNAGDHGERRDRRQDRRVAAHHRILRRLPDIEANAARSCCGAW